MRPFALLALLAVPAVYGQATSADGLPDLSTVSEPTGTPSTSSSTPSSTSASSTAATTSASTETGTQTTTGTTTGVQGVISNAPTIAGAGVPAIVIPFTADAPFMQKSDLPEGTVFIAVGAVLAFLGACVLLWRGSVAWSMNRSVKRAALASIRGTEKLSNWAPSGYNHLGNKGNGYYKEFEASSMSLDALNSAGKNIEKAHTTRSNTHAPPAGLFFSPTAQSQQQVRNTPSPAFDNAGRTSTYLPAGYYASPAADRPASGAGYTTVGGSLAPYARHAASSQSPPRSPELTPTSRSTATYYNNHNNSSREGLRPMSQDGLSRDGYGPAQRTSTLNNYPSRSSLAVGFNAQGSSDNLPGSRAPSAYLENLFENHGNGPRERF